MASTLSATSSWSFDNVTLASLQQSRQHHNASTMPRNGLIGSIKGKIDRMNPGAAKTSNTSSKSRVENTLFPASTPTRRPDRPGMNAFTTPSNEPPPAYTPATNALPMPDTIQTQQQTYPQPIPQNPVQPSQQADDPYAFLGTFDTIFLIDDSGSMAGRSWRECSQALASITPICTAHDHDGIDILFLNAPTQPYHCNVTTASTVQEIFSTVRPGGGTPTGQRLNAILKPYLRELETKPEGTVRPINVIVITDGVPSDDVESVLIAAAKKLDRLDAVAWQVGVQFMQVGNEEGAAEHLAGLDDELSRMGGGCRDIVDTVPMVQGAALTAEGILKTVLGAVNRRLDRRSL